MKHPHHYTLKTRPLTLALSLAMALVLSACGPAKPAAPEAATLRTVSVSEVRTGPLLEAIEVAGSSAFRDETKMAFKVGGVIQNITVREGESVKKGQKLAWLDKQEVQAALAQAQAGWDKAQRDYERGKSLRAQEVISKVQLDNLKTAADLAQAKLKEVQFANQTAEIVARADGVVLKRISQTGEVVAPGQPILLMGSRSSGFVLKASLADRQAIHIKLADQAEVEFDAVPGLKWPASVIEVSQAADPITGTYGVQLKVDTEAHGNITLLSGMQGRARISPATAQRGERSYIPIQAIVEGDNSAAWVFVVQPDNTVKRQSVKIAFVSGDQVALAEPLPAGSKVASTGAAYLRDGEAIAPAGQ